MRTGILTLILMTLMVAPASASLRVGWQDQRAATLADEAPTAFAAANFIGAREMRLIIVWHKVQPVANEWRWRSSMRQSTGRASSSCSSCSAG